ncbi:hypothetical protein Tco_1243729 [Tanacetum coccineum]
MWDTAYWAFLDVGTDTPYLLDGYGIFIKVRQWSFDSSKSWIRRIAPSTVPSQSPAVAAPVAEDKFLISAEVCLKPSSTVRIEDVKFASESVRVDSVLLLNTTSPSQRKEKSLELSLLILDILELYHISLRLLGRICTDDVTIVINALSNGFCYIRVDKLLRWLVFKNVVGVHSKCKKVSFHMIQWCIGKLADDYFVSYSIEQRPFGVQHENMAAGPRASTGAEVRVHGRSLIALLAASSSNPGYVVATLPQKNIVVDCCLFSQLKVMVDFGKLFLF